MIAEFQHEAASTRRMLERVPEDKFSWQPHEKSMSLGRLAGHVAESPGWIAAILDHEELDFSESDYQPFIPTTSAELLEGFDKYVVAFEEAMKDRGDEEFFVDWTMRSGDQVIIKTPRAAAIRGFILSHTYHHRGQLSVYLRLLDVPVPGVYGPTADDESF